MQNNNQLSASHKMIRFYAEGLFPSQCEIEYLVDEGTTNEHTRTRYYFETD